MKSLRSKKVKNLFSYDKYVRLDKLNHPHHMKLRELKLRYQKIDKVKVHNNKE